MSININTKHTIGPVVLALTVFSSMAVFGKAGVVQPDSLENTTTQLVLQPNHESRLFPGGNYLPTDGNLFAPQYQDDWEATRKLVAQGDGSMMIAVEAIAQMDSAELDNLRDFQLANPDISLTVRGNGVVHGCQAAVEGYTDPLNNIGYEAVEYTWETTSGALRILLDHDIAIGTLLNDGPIARLIGAKNLAASTGCDPLDLSVQEAAEAYADYIEISKQYVNWYNAGQDYGNGPTAPLTQFKQPKFVWSMNAANWAYVLPSGETVLPVANGAIQPDGFGLDSHGYVNCDASNDCEPLDLSEVMDTVLAEFAKRTPSLLADLDYIAHEAPYWTFVTGTIVNETGADPAVITDAGIAQLYKEVDWVSKAKTLGIRTGFWVNPYNYLGGHGSCNIQAADPLCSYAANKLWHDEVVANIELFRLAFDFTGLPSYHDVYLLVPFDQNVPTVTLPETHSGTAADNPYTYMQTANVLAKLLLSDD